MRFDKTSGSQGAWLDKKTLKNGDIIKLVTEASLVEGQNGPQIVAKARVKGGSDEALNIAINKPSKNALIEAFGMDSKDWTGHHLTVNVEKTVVGGKRGIALYLIPEGFHVTEDDGGYVVIKKDEEGGDYPAEDISPEDIPF